jgi:hypothetical protein
MPSFSFTVTYDLRNLPYAVHAPAALAAFTRQEQAMGLLVFQCPKTGQAIRSGIQTDLVSLERVRSLPVRVHCPTCRTIHVMRAQDGRIEQSAARDEAA